jgi:hypothetical protein
MERTLLAAPALLLVLLFSSGTSNDDGRAGRTGSPGEQTCVNGCHSTFALNSGAGSVTLGSANMVDWQYEPGVTYNMTVTVSLATSNLFGIGLECLTASGSNAGTIVVTAPEDTRTLNAVVGGNSRRNLVHQLNGGVAAGSKTFNFDWVAPSTNIGNVTFYFAGNAANGNGSSSGDRIYTGSQVITPLITTGLREASEGSTSVRVGPSPFDAQCRIQYSTRDGGSTRVTFLDLGGRTLLQRDLGERTPGSYSETLTGLDALPQGACVMVLEVGEVRSAHKLFRSAL